jgi:hypothetical protein
LGLLLARLQFLNELRKYIHSLLFFLLYKPLPVIPGMTDIQAVPAKILDLKALQLPRPDASALPANQVIPAVISQSIISLECTHLRGMVPALMM